MESKIKEIFEKIKTADRKILIFSVIGFLGIILILLSEIPSSSAKSKSNNDIQYDAYISSLEDETESLISSINGVGRCRVMITLKNTNENVFAKNSEENENDSSYSKKYEYVLYDGQGGDEPVLIKQRFPEVQGVAVVCDGADSEVVRESIVNSISSLFDISASKISVSKYKG